MNEGCPCGAHVNPSYHSVEFVTDTMIDFALPVEIERTTYLPLLLSVLHNTLDLATLCGSPRPDRPRDFGPFDWINPAVGAVLAWKWLGYKLYELVCDCDVCPPITNCGEGGTCITVGPGDGYQPFPDEPGVREYVIPFGSDIWAARVADNHCLGHYSGIDIHWHNGGVFDPSNGVSVCDGHDAGCQSWSQNVLSGVVQLCFGGPQEPAVVHIPPPPDVDPMPGPPACSSSDICTALEYVYQSVSEIRWLVNVIAGPIYGVTAPITATLPGVGAVSGALVDFLPRALAALAPITPAQLENPDTFPVTGASIVELDGQAYVTVELTTVPISAGYRGLAETKQYFDSWSQPGPGYCLVMGQEGVLSQLPLVFGEGVEFPLPPTATSLAFQLAAGVEIEVTLWDRQV